MKLKKILNILIALIVISTAVFVTACTGSEETKQSNQSLDSESSLPLNISVYLDLSDRLTRELSPSQMERDTAIINHLVDLFISDCVENGKIINSKNHFQIFFYPAPNSSQIAQLAKGLNVDMSKFDSKQKKVELMGMKDRIQTNLTQIYTDVLEQQDWVGSDIWGFFSNKEVDKLCIRKDYRNILVILTDGYFYHAKNKIVEDKNHYSYILPKTLLDPDASLIVRRDGLQNLEVLILEVNPYAPNQRDGLIGTIEAWLKEMGVQNFAVNETNLPVSTEVYIDSFIKE